ncbi:sigma-70 family RNA polymerase sigma factor [Patescibacteria group bacterium]|nr:MAG: sigma-70 family RNA polymerase sigma factor [Patescibacteria group bacterium]
MMTPKQKLQRQGLLTTAHHDFDRKLMSHAFYKTNEREKSEDLVQETFTKTWLYLARGGKIDVMRAFLYHVLNNLIVDEYRKHKTLSLELLIGSGYEAGFDPTERLTNSLDGKAALLLIQRLPRPYRNVMRMRYVEDLSLAEIILVTGQSKNALAVQLHRGLAKLKVLYGPL